MAKATIEVNKRGHTGQPAAIRMLYIPYTLNDGSKRSEWNHKKQRSSLWISL